MPNRRILRQKAAPEANAPHARACYFFPSSESITSYNVNRRRDSHHPYPLRRVSPIYIYLFLPLLDGAAAAEEALYIFLSERAEIHIMTAAATAGSQLLVYCPDQFPLV